MSSTAIRPSRCLALAVTALLAPAIDAQQAVGQASRYIIAAGRGSVHVHRHCWMPGSLRERSYVQGNRGRSKVATHALDGRLLGDPANLVVSEDGRTVYVVNHHGAIDNATFRQHGGRGQIAVLDIDDLLSPRNDGSATRSAAHGHGGFGALGIVLLPEVLVIANAENI